MAGHRQIEAFTATRELRITTLDDRELPVQVDGDFIGTSPEYTFTVAPGALTVVA